MWHVYVYGDKAYLPIVAQTEAGFYLDVPPVVVIEALDPSAMTRELVQCVSRGNPKVPTPSRAQFPKPVVLAASGVKTWSAFEKKAICWTITRNGAVYEIQVTGRDAWGKWIDDPSQTESVPVALGLEEVAARLVAQVKRRITSFPRPTWECRPRRAASLT